MPAYQFAIVKVGNIQSNDRFDAYVVGKSQNRVFVVDRGRCKGCRICTSICPYDAIYMSDKSEKVKKSGRGYFYPIENSKCVACKQCVWICPDFALSVHSLDEVKEVSS